MDTIKEKIFDFALGEALTDATNRVYSFLSKDEKNGNLKQKDKDDKISARKHTIINASRDCIKDYITNVIATSGDEAITLDDIDCLFYTTAITVCDNINNINKELKNDTFTFGHAQKLINMTVKYLYIANYFTGHMLDKFKRFHCPMDSKMKDCVVQEYKKHLSSNPKGENLLNGISWSNVSWSKLNLTKNEEDKQKCPAYDAYQKMVRYLAENTIDEDGNRIVLSPLEYDFYMWNNHEENSEQ